MKNERIEQFLEITCRFVGYEERANDIRDELEDHIISKIEEYKGEGYTYEEAVDKALVDMGEAEKLSEQYKIAIPNRRVKYIVTVFLGLLSCISIAIIQNRLKGRFWGIVSLVFYILGYLILLMPIVKAQSAYNKYLKENPLFFIQVTNNPALRVGKNVIKIICFIGMVLMITLSYSEYASGVSIRESVIANLDIIPIAIVFPLVISIIFDMSGAVVYKEGMLLPTCFVKWDNILGYRWNRNYSGGEAYYMLQLKLKKENGKANKLFPRIANLYVGHYQMQQIEKIMASKKVPYCTYM